MKRSISDDDLCATCRYCKYVPGGMSSCKQFDSGLDANGQWPAVFDPDGYAQNCSFYQVKTVKQPATADVIEVLSRQFNTPGRHMGEVPTMDLQEAVRRLAKLVLDDCGGRPGIGSPELEALQYAAVAVTLSERQLIDPSKFVVLTIEEAERLAHHASWLKERCNSTRLLERVAKNALKDERKPRKALTDRSAPKLTKGE